MGHRKQFPVVSAETFIMYTRKFCSLHALEAFHLQVFSPQEHFSPHLHRIQTMLAQIKTEGSEKFLVRISPREMRSAKGSVLQHKNWPSLWPTKPNSRLQFAVEWHNPTSSDRDSLKWQSLLRHSCKSRALIAKRKYKSDIVACTKGHHFTNAYSRLQYGRLGHTEVCTSYWNQINIIVAYSSSGTSQRVLELELLFSPGRRMLPDRFQHGFEIKQKKLISEIFTPALLIEVQLLSLPYQLQMKIH
jgi:hypothetical protein